MKVVNLILIAAISIYFGVIFTGCGATDWATRDIPDGSSINEGESVTIVQKDGITYTGRYKGTILLSSSEYAEEYSRGSNQVFDGKMLPELGKDVRILTTISDSRVWAGKLVGFDTKSLWMMSYDSRELQKVYFTSLRFMSAKNNQVFHRMHLRELFVNGDIPLMSALAVENASGIYKIPISMIDYIRLGDDGTTVSVSSILSAIE